jgi:hypothetical protein
MGLVQIDIGEKDTRNPIAKRSREDGTTRGRIL